MVRSQTRDDKSSSSSKDPTREEEEQEDFYWNVDESTACLSSFASFQKPVYQWKVSDGVLYSIQITTKKQAGDGSRTNELLIVSGDEGVLVLEWPSELFEGSVDGAEDAAAQSDASPKQVSKFTPHPSPWEARIEVNQCCHDDHGDDHLYGAAGDSFGCYKWNLTTEQLVKTYPSPGRGYLQTVKLLSSSLSPRLLFTGGQDGILGLWDVQQDRLVEQYDVNSVLDGLLSNSSKKSKGTSPTSHGNSSSGNNKRKTPSKSRWISSIAGVKDSWWAIGGGSSSSNTNSNNSNKHDASGGSGGGFLATYHEPTRSFVSCTETKQAIHQLDVASVAEYGGSSSGAVGGVASLASVGNDSIASCWDPWTYASGGGGGGRPQQQQQQQQQEQHTTWCSHASGYAVAAAPTGGRLAVAGVGSNVDLLEDNQVVFRFHVAL